MTVHEFDPARAGEHDAHDWWPLFYSRAFPDYVTHAIVTDKRRQKQGIDHIIKLKGGAEVTVDAKCRCTAKEYHDDILVEAWSDFERKIDGWARKSLHCHYLAYVWPKVNHGQHGLLIPFQLLRAAYEENKHSWFEAGYFNVNARNKDYTTRSFAIPRDRLVNDLSVAMTVYFNDDQRPM